MTTTITVIILNTLLFKLNPEKKLHCKNIYINSNTIKSFLFYSTIEMYLFIDFNNLIKYLNYYWLKY